MRTFINRQGASRYRLGSEGSWWDKTVTTVIDTGKQLAPEVIATGYEALPDGVKAYGDKFLPNWAREQHYVLAMKNFEDSLTGVTASQRQVFREISLAQELESRSQATSTATPRVLNIINMKQGANNVWTLTVAIGRRSFSVPTPLTPKKWLDRFNQNNNSNRKLTANNTFYTPQPSSHGYRPSSAPMVTTPPRPLTVTPSPKTPPWLIPAGIALAVLSMVGA